MSEIQIAGTWCPTIIVFLTVQDQGPEGSSPDFGGGCCLWDPVESQSLPTNVVRCCQTLKAPGDESKWGPKSNNKSVLKGPSGGKSMAFSVCAMVRIWSTCSHKRDCHPLSSPHLRGGGPPWFCLLCFITPMNYSYDDHKPE